MNCAISQAELNHDISQAQLERKAIATALEQLASVNYVAKGLLAGHAIVDTRKVGAVVDGVQKKVQITYSMKNVAEQVAEELTAEHCYELIRGTPKALFDMQKMIGEAAHVVAFDALNLWSSPFIDLSDLRETAEQANAY